MLAPLPSRALIEVTGEDWRTFLQGQLTQDVATLAPGEARFGALLTPQGRLLYDLFIVGRDDGCWLDVEREHREALIRRLTLFRLRAKVTFVANDSPVLAHFSPPPCGEGAGGGGVGSASVGVSPPPQPLPAGGRGFVRDPRLPELGWRGYATPAHADADEAAYDLHRLRLGVPGPADWGSDRTYPIEANFDLLNGIDFKKGCFVGQETTSRMKRRGQIKNRMLPIAFDAPPPPFGAEVLNGERRAGEVLSGQDGHAMALLRLDRLEGELTADGRKIRVAQPAY
ncbi:MAG TPA: folate-binding protein YgfZ, partial [Caulobacteraceae bacterium]|nr:folate-binding protein YgfZ [Caulobacteraceae bacterium]